MGKFLRDIMKQNLDSKNFRLFSPDENNSNRWQDVLDVTNRCYMADIYPEDDKLSPDGRVMEVLSEHQCQGWLEGVPADGPAWDRSMAWLHEALAIYRAEQVAAGQAAALFWLGRAHGDPAEARRCFCESLELSMQLGESVGVGMCRVFISVLAARDGDLDDAVRLAEQVVEECCASGVHYPVGQALVLLASIAHRRGQDDAARAFLHDAVTHSRDVGDRRQLASVLIDLAALEASMGRGAEALQALAESSQLDEQIGRLPSRSYQLAVVALAHLARSERVLAISALGGATTCTPASSPSHLSAGSVGTSTGSTLQPWRPCEPCWTPTR